MWCFGLALLGAEHIAGANTAAAQLPLLSQQRVSSAGPVYFNAL